MREERPCSVVFCAAGCGNEPLLKPRITLDDATDGDKGNDAAGEGEVEEPVGEGEVEEPAGEGEVEEPVGEGEVEEPAGEGEVETPVDPRLPVQPTFACAPGAVVDMTYLITANDMRGAGASAPGRCFGTVKFSDDLASQGTWSQFHYDDDNSSFVEDARDYNGSSRLVTPDCGVPHCADVGFDDGSVHTDYCTIVATCDGTTARAIGYTW